MLPKKRAPTHPGKILLKDFLEPMGLTQKAFAAHIGWSYARLNEIIHAKRGVSVDSALDLADVFKMEAQFWLNLQQNWDMWHARKKHHRVKPIRMQVA